MCAFLNHRSWTAQTLHRKKHSTLALSHIHTALPFLPSGAPLTQNTHICAQPHTHTLRFILRRGLHYTGITKRNVLIKLCRQLQTARRENGNDVVHQALKENTSRGLYMCAYNGVSVCACSFLPLSNMSSCGGHAVPYKDTQRSETSVQRLQTEYHIYTFRFCCRLFYVRLS